MGKFLRLNLNFFFYEVSQHQVNFNCATTQVVDVFVVVVVVVVVFVVVIYDEFDVVVDPGKNYSLV